MKLKQDVTPGGPWVNGLRSALYHFLEGQTSLQVNHKITSQKKGLLYLQTAEESYI